MLTTAESVVNKLCDMDKPVRSQKKKMLVRRHFIKEWMEFKNMKAADLIERLDADRSTVYRWLDGQMPQPTWHKRIAALFSVESDALLRHPDDIWLSRFFHGRDEKEIQRIKQAMELAWPKQS